MLIIAIASNQYVVFLTKYLYEEVYRLVDARGSEDLLKAFVNAKEE
jgi:hypothetical protein